MQRHRLRPLLPVVCLTLCSLSAVLVWPARSTVSAASDETAGSLGIVGRDGSVKSVCPLRHTEVRGAISGFLARVSVTQTFQNSASQTIEAVYTFPLPDNAAVDDMTIQIGNRTVRGVIRKREEARAIYEKAKQTGHVAALLDQERPNIFTQAVANITPGEQVTVTISYLQTLEYENGSYQFVFPMVVGPRYIPGEPVGKQATGWAPDTEEVHDASKITPHVTPEGTRTGHDISIELAIDSGVPLIQLRSSSHQIETVRTGASSATVKLKNLAEIPNKDFILKYGVAGKQLADAVFSQAESQTVSNAKGGTGGYFTLILQPPDQLPESDITPKELVFVLDTSGSMMGFPIEKAKEFINHALDELYPSDTFNLITFSGDTRILFPEPVFPTAANIAEARAVLNAQHGGGGTVMMKAIQAALAPSDSPDHLRVVCFLTDGYVGNDLEIIGEVQKHLNARVFAYGIGKSVNRFLIESMAKAGRGDSEVVALNDKADAAAHRLYQRLRAPVLTDVSIDWRGLPVTDVLPARLPDLFTGKPLVVSGRYTAPATGSILIRGKRAGDDFTREIPIHFNSSTADGNILPSFWARRKIDDLMSQDWAGLQSGNVKPDVQQAITQLGLSYKLMTQFTSFVAVELRVVTTNGVPSRVEVPVEMPEGVSYEGVFGREEKDALLYTPSAGLTSGYSFQSVTQFAPMARSAPAAPRAAKPSGVVGSVGVGSGSAGGVGAGQGGGIGGGVYRVGGAPQTNQAQTNLSPTTVEDVSSLAPDTKAASERALLESKLSPAVLDRFDCWKKQSSACKLAPDGTIELQLFLTDDSPPVVDTLKAIGLAISEDRPKQKVLIGRLSLDKLTDLARMREVRFVARR